MPQRRSNDSQVERLLHALKTDLSYRQDLAARIAEKENIKYASAMRRLQRYITEAGEKRSFTRAPVEQRRVVREDYREHERQEIQREQRLKLQDRIFVREEQRVHLNDLRAVISYHDGNLRDTARALSLSKRAERLLDFQVRSDLADTHANVLEMTGGGEIQDAIREFLNEATPGTAQELQDFAEIFFNRSDWEIGIILEDLRSGKTTFADWMDAWTDDDFNPDAQNSEYWRVWREAYARVTA